jgi:hypothetical protein
VVGSGQDVWGYGFSIALMIGVVDEKRCRERAGGMESAHAIGMPATEYGWSPWQDGLVGGVEHTCREHRQRQVQGSGLNMWSGRVIGTCRSSFGEEDLSGSKSLDKIHGALAARARPCGWLGGGGCICCRRRLAEQAAAERKQTSTGAVGQPAEVADAGEASGQHMLEEAAQELLRRERHGALLAAMRVVLPAEGDSGVGDGEQAMVGDGEALVQMASFPFGYSVI